MSDTRVTRVLILAEPATGYQWEKTLCSPEILVWTGRTAIPAGEHPEIILADASAPPVVSRDEVGVILVDGDGPADVRLSANCTAAELQLACRLLGEIVRLRRLQREACQAHRELAQAALTDPLTELPNRRAWDQELAQRLARAADGRLRLCVSVFDLDQFKEINDTQGHAVGDRVLQAVGDILQKSLRHGDFVARLGGDEFGALLWVPSEVEAATIIQRARDHVAEVVSAQQSLKITASAGFALGGTLPGPDTCETLFLAADAALIAAKREGKNTMRGG